MVILAIFENGPSKSTTSKSLRRLFKNIAGRNHIQTGQSYQSHWLRSDLDAYVWRYWPFKNACKHPPSKVSFWLIIRLRECRFRLQKETKSYSNFQYYFLLELQHSCIAGVVWSHYLLIHNDSLSFLWWYCPFNWKKTKIPFQVTKRGQNEKWISFLDGTWSSCV